jgi:pyrroloquinoline quinone biosynthesis protein E
MPADTQVPAPSSARAGAAAVPPTPRLDFELTAACDHRCGHCYNVWNASPGDPQGGYPKGQLTMMRKAVTQSGARHITLTGGEPLLRKDALDVVALACELVPSVQLITNGSHVSPAVAQRLAALQVRSVQLTLLSADGPTHDRLKGAACFDDTVRAALDLTEAGVPVQVCFVAMAKSRGELAGVMELCYALGVRALTYNRMSPTGWAVHDLPQLLPAVADVERDLATADRLGRRFGMHVATAMPIPPCLVRLERYPGVKFGFCSVGSHTPNITVDALGNVRSCNLSGHVMGNVVAQDWPDIVTDPYLSGFKAQVPEVCRGCRYETTCQGGCKESGFATYGDLSAPEPFLRQGLPEAATPAPAPAPEPPPASATALGSASAPASASAPTLGGLAKVALGKLSLTRRGG